MNKNHQKSTFSKLWKSNKGLQHPENFSKKKISWILAIAASFSLFGCTVFPPTQQLRANSPLARAELVWISPKSPVPGNHSPTPYLQVCLHQELTCYKTLLRTWPKQITDNYSAQKLPKRATQQPGKEGDQDLERKTGEGNIHRELWKL